MDHNTHSPSFSATSREEVEKSEAKLSLGRKDGVGNVFSHLLFLIILLLLIGKKLFSSNWICFASDG